MAKEHIVIIEDEEDVQELLRYNLKKEGYVVTEFSEGLEALEFIRKNPPQLVLLDLMLPDVDGFEICKRLKSAPETAFIPIIMLTARSEEADIVAGLEIGADDYVTKPFSPRVLLARIKNLLKRRENASAREKEILFIHGIRLDPLRHRVTVDGKNVNLTRTEFKILYLLASHPGWVYSRYEIVNAVKGENYPVTERSVDVQIVSLRKKLKEAGKYIETVRGVGYRFRDEE